MKPRTVNICGILAALVALAFAGCAQTTFYDRKTARPIARFQGDMTNSHYVDGPTTWDVAQVSHSTATVAQGAAAANVIGATGAAVAGAALAVGSSGLIPGAAAVAVPAISSFVNRPAALQAK